MTAEEKSKSAVTVGLTKSSLPQSEK